ncbi:rhomboid family intramembrane serine protease [Ruficoccus sp. ZRK36]|uniref:rhomboid family intramembrane serine protease n=1 Tax=Ruficoccus sp. ZRK36 TaxID=2866311 RepID=UPI001C72AD11|nr:rhomboid family intramembrane serine protease [Ruficoccus sp. ZRK36]QYY35600.1 rhomboid family intramembrane serine protease [Ruficoccus sp. ZRK36]
MGKNPPYLYWFLGVLVGGFVLQMMLVAWFRMSGVLSSWVALSPSGLMSFKVWTLASYALLHGGFWHLLGNGLGIFFLGRALLPEVGHKRLTQLSVVMIVAGGVLWTLVHLTSPGSVLIGASAASLGLLTLFCLLHPDETITLLLFFILPLRLQPKWLLWGALAINGAGFLFYEIPMLFGAPPLLDMGPVGWSAHLGGMLVGYLYYAFVMRGVSAPWMPRRSVKIEPPSWMRRKKAAAGSARPFKLNISNRSALRKEVDRILDKINHEGFGALNAEERDILEQAKDILNK